MLNILIIREKVKAIIRYNLTSVRMVIIKKEHKLEMLVRMWRNENPCMLLVGI